MFSRPIALSLVIVSMASCSAAAQPVGWRCDGTGIYPAANPPTNWSAEQNIVWKTATPSWSNASPAIVGDRMFICREPDTLMCLALADGKVIWEAANPYESLLTDQQRADAAENEKKAKPIRQKAAGLQKQLGEVQKARRKSPKDEALKAKADALKKQLADLRKHLEPLEKFKLPATHKVNGHSSPTPTSDGRYVYVLFGSGLAACYDMNGKRQWARLVERPAHDYGQSASPLLVGGKLIVHVTNVTALDVRDGRTIWQAESRQCWGSPVKATIDGAEVIITASGDIIRADDGKTLATKLCALEYCAPIVHEGIVYFIQHGGKAIRLPDKADGQAQPSTLWQTNPPKDRYYASPAYHNGLIYAITQASVLSVIDAADGGVIYSKKLDLGKGTVFSSVTAAGGYIFIFSDTGKALVLEPGREYKQVAANALEGVRTTPVFLGNRIYMRGIKHAYCLGQ